MRWLRAAGWFGGYLALTFVLLLPLSTNLDTHLPDDGDAVLGLWIVWWSATHLAEGYPGIFDANAFYPHPQGLLYSEPMLSQGLVASPLFQTFENPVLAMNLLTLLTLAMSACAAHLLFKELTKSTAGAVVAAVFFTFNAFNFSQLARIQLITLQWLPLALFCLHRYYARNRKAYLLGFFVFSVMQSLACFYYLLFYLVALTVLLPTYLWAFPEHRNARSVAWVGASGLLVGAVLAAVALPYLELYAHYEFSSEPGSFDLAGYFVPRSENLLYRFLDIRPIYIDHFLGYAGIALALAGVAIVFGSRDREEVSNRRLALGILVVSVLAFFFSAGPELRFAGTRLGPGPFVLLQPIGPFRNLRTPDRFSVLVMFGMAFFIAHAVSALFDGRRGNVTLAGVVVLAALMLGEHWSPRRTQGTEIPTPGTLPDAYTWLAQRDERGVLAELPPRPFREMRFVTLDAYFSTFHEHTILFNKPSFYPPAMELIEHELSSFPTRRSLSILQGLGIRELLVHPKRWGEGIAHRARLRAIERRLPEATLVAQFPFEDREVWDRYQLGGERLYGIPPLEEEETPRQCACREIPRDTISVDGSGVNAPDRAIDGNRETRWTTGDTPRKGSFFEIDFGRTRRPVRIELEMGFPWGEFPRRVAVNGFDAGDGQRIHILEDVWYTLRLIRQLVEDPKKARYRIDLEPREVDRLRLFINVREPGGQPWSIHELHVYEFAAADQESW